MLTKTKPNPNIIQAMPLKVKTLEIRGD